MLARVFVAAIVSAVLSGCGGSSSGGAVAGTVVSPQSDANGCPTIAGTGRTDLAGIYDITNYSRSPANVMYTVIGSDGIATDFDFDGDDFGDGRSCFVKGQEGFASITRITGDRYSWTFGNPFDDTGCAYARDEVQITRSGNKLNISNEAGMSIEWRVVTEASISDLTTCP